MTHKWGPDPSWYQDDAKRTLPKRYVDVDVPYVGETKPGQVIAVRDAAWEVQGPTRVHRFVHVTEARAVAGNMPRIHVESFVVHLDARPERERFAWGHSIADAYGSSAELRKDGERSWYAGLIGAHVIREDLPCCGGRWIKEREDIDYSTTMWGHCDACGARWTVVDGCRWYWEEAKVTTYDTDEEKEREFARRRCLPNVFPRYVDGGKSSLTVELNSNGVNLGSRTEVKKRGKVVSTIIVLPSLDKYEALMKLPVAKSRTS